MSSFLLNAPRVARTLAVLAIGIVGVGAMSPVKASTITYTISGQGSFEEPGVGNTGGYFSFRFTGGDTGAGNAQYGLLGTLALTPYSAPSTPSYSGILTSNTLLELIPGSSPPYLFALSSVPSVTTFIQLTDPVLSTISLDAPFSVDIPLAGVSIPLQPIYVGGDLTHYAYIESLFTPISFTATIDAVPEPSTWAMLIVGFAGLGFMARRQAVRRSSALISAC